MKTTSMSRLLVVPVLAVLGAGCPLQTPGSGEFTTGAVASLSIALVGGTNTPAVGTSVTMTATPVFTAGKTFDTSRASWRTSNAAVLKLQTTTGATVAAQALKAGMATVTAELDGKTATMPFVVGLTVGSVTVTGDPGLDIGESKTYTAEVKDPMGAVIAGAPISWYVTGSGAAVDGPGTGASVRVKGVMLGSATVNALSGGVVGSKSIAVGGATLLITAAGGGAVPAKLPVGSPIILTSYAVDKGGGKTEQTSTWSSTGPCMVTRLGGSATANAQVVGTGPGACMITAEVGGVSASVTITMATVTAVMVTVDSAALKLAETRMATAKVLAGADDLSAYAQVVWVDGAGAVSASPDASAPADRSKQTLTGNAVGTSSLVASVGGVSSAPVALEVVPVSLAVTPSATAVLAGGAVTLTVEPKDGTGLAHSFLGAAVTAARLSLSGTTGATASAPSFTGSAASFTLSSISASLPMLKVSYAAGGSTTSSDPVAISVAVVATVEIKGPVSPLTVGATADLTAVAKDAGGAPIGGVMAVTWSSGNGVVSVPSMSGGTTVATVARLGTSDVTATIAGITSAAYAVRTQPASVGLVVPKTSLAVNETTTAVVTLYKVGGASIAPLAVGDVSLTSADGGKVSVGTGSAASGAVSFVVTGVAQVASPGVALTAKWTNGTETLMPAASTGVVVTAGVVTWTSPSCTAAWKGPRSYEVSGFTGATSPSGTVVYDVYSAYGAPASTSGTKDVTGAADGATAPVIPGSVAADVRFGVVARAPDGGTSALVACTPAAMPVSPSAATSAVLLARTGVYVDDTTTGPAAQNPSALVQVAPAGSTVERTAPRILAGGALVGIGARASDGKQVIYDRLPADTGRDIGDGLAVVNTDLSAGVCADRLGITAFPLQGKTSPAGSLVSFAVFTQTATPTGDAADCSLNVLGQRSGAVKPIISGVTAATGAGSTVIVMLGGQLYGVDLSTGLAPTPQRLTAESTPLPASVLLAVYQWGNGNAVFVLDPADGTVYRATIDTATFPWAAAEKSAATASLAGADGLYAFANDSLFVSVGGVIKKVVVSGAGTPTLTVTSRDYSGSFGSVPVTLGASKVAGM